MPLQTQPIPSLHGGVSQQAAINRLPTQCEEGTKNCSFGLAQGVSKRPPLEFVRLLDAGVDLSEAFIHWMPHPEGRWVLLVIPGDGSFRAYDVTTGNVGTVTGDATGHAYLTSTGPANRAFRAVADEGKTYIVNREVVAAFDGGTEPGSIAGTAQTLQDEALDTAANGSIWRIRGSQQDPFSQYYAKNEGSVWVEWVLPGITNQLDAGTMPHQFDIVYSDVAGGILDTQFTAVAWEPRKVGDEKTNKQPSFAGKTIRSISLASDRLVLTSDRGISMSETGEKNNFFRTTVTSVLDSDRIDVTAEGGVRPIDWISYVSGQWVVFAGPRQYSLTSGEALTPSSVTLRPITTYPSSSEVEPQVSGPNVYFASNGGDWLQLREMFLQEDSVTLDAANASAHVFEYIDRDPEEMAVSTDFGHLVIRPNAAHRYLASYQFDWAGDEKVVSAWNKWEVAGRPLFTSMQIIDNYLYVTYILDGGQDDSLDDAVYLGRFDLGPGRSVPGFDHDLYLDHRVVIPAEDINYNSVSDRTFFTLPWDLTLRDSQYENLAIVAGENSAQKGRVWRVQDYPGVQLETATQFSLPGDLSVDNQSMVVGYLYERLYRFSEQFIQDSSGRVMNARVQLRSMHVHFTDTVAFGIRVDHRGREADTFDVIPQLRDTYTSRTLNDAWFQLNEPQLSHGVFDFPILGKASDAVIDIVDSSPYPSHFQAAEWKALVSLRHGR